MINIEEEYLGLMAGILNGGKSKESRNGTGTISVFGRQIRHDMALGFPLLTTKKIYWNNGLTELLWILQGRTDLAYLTNHGVNYWTPDYKRSERTDGSLGPIYGHQLRNYGGVDQLEEVLKLIKQEPSSRRIMASLWNPIDMDDMALPPCHYGFQININDGKMDLMWNQRSADVFLGLPYDILMYGLLLVLLAYGNGYTPGQLIANLGDCHLYKGHEEAAQMQLSRELRTLPTVEVDWGLQIHPGANNFIHIPAHKDIHLKDYNPHSPIKAELYV